MGNGSRSVVAKPHDPASTGYPDFHALYSYPQQAVDRLVYSDGKSAPLLSWRKNNAKAGGARAPLRSSKSLIACGC
jgi:hypothetical protein